MKISVIMPVYNSEQYIGETLKCVLGQTHKDIEVICVLDKPVDSSEKVIKGFDDSRIKIINLPEHVGTANAKNKGVEIATGEWIHFMDSDDLINPEFYEKMLEQSTSVDVVACSVFYEANPKHSIWFQKKEIVSGKAKWKKTEVLIHGWMWRYLIRREFWNYYKLRFPNLMVMEDQPAMVEMIYHADKIAFAPDAVYFYKKRASSIVASFTDRKRIDWEIGRELVAEFVKKHKIRKPSRLMYLIKRM